MSYRTWLARLAATPSLSAEVSQRFLLGMWGTLSDSVAAAMLEGLYLPWLTMGEAKAEDVLSRIGQERRMPRFSLGGVGEGVAPYRLRLMAAWRSWEYAGTAAVLIEQLALMGLSNCEVKEPKDWNWDGNAADWSRFWVVIHPPHPWLQGPRWGDVPVGTGEHYADPSFTYGSSMTINEVEMLRRTVRQWKPAHVRCARIIVVFDEAAWLTSQPDGTWNSRANRNPAAIYIAG
jgi:hypothetical protein